MEAKEPDIIKDSNKRIEVFEVLQQSCIDSGLHIIALDCLKS